MMFELNIHDLTKTIIYHIQTNQIATASKTLYEAVHEVSVDSKDINDDLKILIVRFLGHIGEYSEAIRILTEIINQDESNIVITNHAKVRLAVLWLRLSENEKAFKIFDSIENIQTLDEEHYVLYVGHLMTLSYELDDKELWFHSSRLVDGIKYKEQINKNEILLWKEIFSCFINSNDDKNNLDDKIKKVHDIKKLLHKSSYNSYLYYRIGNLYEKLNSFESAYSNYSKAREEAFKSHQAVSLLMINNSILSLYENKYIEFPKDFIEKIIKESCVVAGQHGIGLIPCKLSRKIWYYSSFLSKNLKNVCRAWIFTERFMPNLNKLKGDNFESFCHALFTNHGKEIFKADVTVKMESARKAILDLIISFKFPTEIKFAVQCKGGSSISLWTKKRLIRILGDDALFRANLFSLREEGFSGYIFVCTTRLDKTGIEWLNSNHKKVFNCDCIKLDYGDISGFLYENPNLRLQLALLINNLEDT